MLVASLAASGPAGAREEVDEVGGTRRVCETGPAHAVARATRMRGEAAVASAGVLPNPALSLEHDQTLAGPAERETIATLHVPLGIGGRRFLLQDAAEARRHEATMEAAATLFDRALAFREAYVAAALDRARLRIMREQQQKLDAMTVTVRGLAKRGESAGYDILRQETQARLHRRGLAAAEARAAASRALLSGWLERDVEVAEASFDAVAAAPHAAAGEPALPPRVQALEAAARASGFEARAARRRWVPDLDVFAGYRVLSGSAAVTGHGVSVGVTVPLSFFDHGQGEAARAEAERAFASASAWALQRDAGARARAAAARALRLAAAAAEIDRAVTDAGVLETKASQLYAAGEATIVELLDAFRAAEEARLARVDAAGELASARLELMRASGTMFDATLDKACGASGGTR